jgi:uncharacterized SAM-binding protein YcdF (DUF218 family)
VVINIILYTFFIAFCICLTVLTFSLCWAMLSVFKYSRRPTIYEGPDGANYVVLPNGEERLD